MKDWVWLILAIAAIAGSGCIILVAGGSSSLLEMWQDVRLLSSVLFVTLVLAVAWMGARRRKPKP